MALIEPIDHNDPLFLHSSDHPSLSLVPQVFDGTNFGEWRISMQIALSAKNKAEFINGNLARPPRTDARYDRWERCNNMVIMWLLNGLSPMLRRSVSYTDTARGIWEELMARFDQTSGAQLYSVEKELSSLSQGSSSISVYFTKIKTLWDELNSMHQFLPCTCGCMQAILKHDEDRRLVHFLMGLNEQYTSIKGAILMMNPLPSVNHAYSFMLQEEKQREIQSPAQAFSESASMSVNARTSNSLGYNQKGNGEKRALYCTNCKKTNHTIDKCFFLNGFPLGYRENKGKKEESEKKFTGNSIANELSSDHISQLLGLLNPSHGKGKEILQDDFANFTGAFYEDSIDGW